MTDQQAILIKTIQGFIGERLENLNRMKEQYRLLSNTIPRLESEIQKDISRVAKLEGKNDRQR